MTKKIRLIIFLAFVVIYFTFAPVLVLYSLGYRFDFENKKIVSTGGLDMRVWPQDADVSIDGKKPKRAGMFSNEVFLQGLLPKNYAISVSKDGYFNWTKTLPVKEKEVTEIKNITLIKENIIFDGFSEGLLDLSFSPDNRKALLAEIAGIATKLSIVDLTTKDILGSAILPFLKFDVLWSNDSNKVLLSDAQGKYFIFDYLITQSNALKQFLPGEKNISDVSFNPRDSNELFFVKNNGLYSGRQPNKIIISGLVAYQMSANKITWLSETGMLYGSEMTGNITETLTTKSIALEKKIPFSIAATPQTIFLKQGESIFFLDQKTANLRDFYAPANGLAFSPDSKRVLYFNDNEVLFSNLSELSERNSIISSTEKITNCSWLNNDYIIIETENKIKISEIDTRDRVNIVSIPQQISLSSGATAVLNSPKTFFNQDNKKLYLLNEGVLLVSERLTQ